MVNLRVLLYADSFLNVDTQIAIFLAIELSILSNFMGHQLWTFNDSNIKKKPFIIESLTITLVFYSVA